MSAPERGMWPKKDARRSRAYTVCKCGHWVYDSRIKAWTKCHKCGAWMHKEWSEGAGKDAADQHAEDERKRLRRLLEELEKEDDLAGRQKGIAAMRAIVGVQDNSKPKTPTQLYDESWRKLKAAESEYDRLHKLHLDQTERLEATTIKLQEAAIAKYQAQNEEEQARRARREAGGIGTPDSAGTAAVSPPASPLVQREHEENILTSVCAGIAQMGHAGLDVDILRQCLEAGRSARTVDAAAAGAADADMETPQLAGEQGGGPAPAPAPADAPEGQPGGPPLPPPDAPPETQPLAPATQDDGARDRSRSPHGERDEDPAEQDEDKARRERNGKELDARMARVVEDHKTKEGRKRCG